MLDYQVKFQTVTVGGTDYVIRSLLDLQQYADTDGEAALTGISPASWSLFGHLWPSARILALCMDSYELTGKRILEIGAGLALASLVIHRRQGDMTVSDWHPLSEIFLNENLLLNKMLPMHYQIGNWETSNPELGQFDLIIGSDILYERQQASQLAHFINQHTTEAAEIIIVDPDRGNRVRFCREMNELGYGFNSRRAESFTENGDPYKGCFLTFSRSLFQVDL
ncbi:SAM-dependent methyltransferase [Methylomonas sp. AM2-LC]|uniref:class I SAM-dependent methyltransferase n=1 Tax=Methylomonas sp. AM2-LC TaxID=3153301 RepID=UPI003267F138